MDTHRLPLEEILDAPLAPPPLPGVAEPGRPAAHHLGDSRRGRPIHGWKLGRGPHRISLIGGAHADEPVGPATLRRLVSALAGLEASHALLTDWTWLIVPHVNPDGAAANDTWPTHTVPVEDSRGTPDRGFLLSAYLEGAVREPPGEDLEFGFPRGLARGEEDPGARPEARAVAGFLRSAAPFTLHASLHGMAFGTGPWFLLERTWAERTGELRRRLRERVAAMGYRLHDVDRRGEKGFWRIGEGFCSRPDSEAMRRHFLDRGEPETAELFRPSSMETARSFGGDPLTVVTEMPLFLVPEGAGTDGSPGDPPMPLDPERRKGFSAWVHQVRRTEGWGAVDARCRELGIRPMPIRDQMRLQLAYLDEAMEAVRRELDSHGG